MNRESRITRRRITIIAAAVTLIAAVAFVQTANADATPVMPAYLSSGLAECKAQQAVATTSADRTWANECVRLAQRAVDAWTKANPTPTPTATGTPTATPTTAPPTTPPVTTPPPTTVPPTPSPTGTTGPNPLSGLPLIAWEGGPAYWAQFPKAVAAGWTSPNFFPIVGFWESFSSDTEVKYDKAHGINTYLEGYPNYADYAFLKNNNMFWISDAPNSTFPSLTASAADSSQWPGVVLGDEPDGAHGSAAADLAYVQGVEAANPENGRWRMWNFTQISVGDYGSANNTTYTQMLNSYRGPVSTDTYWYTIPTCGPGNSSYDFMIIGPVDAAHCRTSSSYGDTMKSLRQRDAADGVLRPVWQFIENLNGGPGEGPFVRNITPAELKGAAMDSIINEARGIQWFNTSLTGPCSQSVVLRATEYGAACAQANMDAMGAVNLQIQRLAPVINTQSYQWSFGPRLDTMLKWYQGSAYVFAMINGAADSVAGGRTFTLPPGLAGATSVQVVDEGRSIPVVGGQFSDTFAAESTYHIYKVTP